MTVTVIEHIPDTTTVVVDRIDRMVRPLPARAAEDALPTLAEIVEAWALGWPLRQAVEHLATAADVPAVGDHHRAQAQIDALKRAFGFLLRAHRGVAEGLIVAQHPRPARAAAHVTADDAAQILGLSSALGNALRAIRAATLTVLADQQRVFLEEAMAALNTAISIREAVR